MSDNLSLIGGIVVFISMHLVKLKWAPDSKKMLVTTMVLSIVLGLLSVLADKLIEPVPVCIGDYMYCISLYLSWALKSIVIVFGTSQTIYKLFKLSINQP